ncbi:chloride channel protein [Flavobacteriaceae bacterium Ap0902]|nr:chloride channel protein [Flavobacteriaceae bacterium Ap0902]
MRLYLSANLLVIKNKNVHTNILQAIPFWVGAVISGIIAVLYAWLIDKTEHYILEILAWKSWLIFFISPIGFIGSWWLVQRFAPYAKGSGVPQVMAAVELSTPVHRHLAKHLLSLKIMIIKVLSSMLLVFGGGAVGREGPTIQVSSSVFRVINDILPSWWPSISRKNMIMAGSAAGLSAAFNTPLAGIVFAIEELSKTELKYIKTSLFTGVLIAGLTAQLLAGSYLYLGYPNTKNVTIQIIPAVIVVSLIGGIMSGYQTRFLFYLQGFRRKFKKNKEQIILLFIFSMIISCVIFFVSNSIMGSGKNIMETALFDSSKKINWYTPFLRMLGNGLSFNSGGAGGIFAPALSIGASIGAVFGELSEYTSQETRVLILVGMVAFLSGITRAPFTSSIIVLEMTDRHSLLFYLIIAGMVGNQCSRWITKEALYSKLNKSYIRELKERKVAKSDS